MTKPPGEVLRALVEGEYPRRGGAWITAAKKGSAGEAGEQAAPQLVAPFTVGGAGHDRRHAEDRPHAIGRQAALVPGGLVRLGEDGDAGDAPRGDPRRERPLVELGAAARVHEEGDGGEAGAAAEVLLDGGAPRRALRLGHAGIAEAREV